MMTSSQYKIGDCLIFSFPFFSSVNLLKPPHEQLTSMSYE